MEILRDVGDKITRRDRLNDELSELHHLKSDTTLDIERVQREGLLSRQRNSEGRVSKRGRGVDHEGDNMKRCDAGNVVEDGEVIDETFIEATRKRSRK